MVALPSLALAAALAAAGPVCVPPAGAAPGAACVQPPADPAVAAAIEARLGAIDRGVRPESWRALGPAAVAPLRAIVDDRAQLPYRRARALEALAAVQGQAAGPLHLRVAADATEPYAVRLSALEGAGSVLPPASLAAGLRPLLHGDADPRIRARAAEVLARHAPEAACGEIRAEAARIGERGPALMARAIATCGR